MKSIEKSQNLIFMIVCQVRPGENYPEVYYNKKRTRRTSSMSNKEPKSDEGSAPPEKAVELAIKKPKSCTSCVMNIL